MPLGTGYCTTLTAKGITLNGHSSGWPHISDSGTVRPWSTSILLTMVRSKSCWITECAMCEASSGAPITLGTGRGPQPSSAGAYSAAVPMAKVGIISRLNGRGVVVEDQEHDVGLVLLDPLAREVVAGEDLLPVRLLVLPRSIAAPMAGTCEV
jgi:hypothetical protein